jgi:DNA/RNA-binding domain of Phe-tRNA-synthetase-like protein
VITATVEWKSRWPGAVVGVLAMRSVRNPDRCEALEALKPAIEAGLRDRFAAGGKAAIRADPAIAAYDAYYRRFGNTYHVTAQVESVALKGRSIPSVAALVEAMFMAELSGMLLTAGHDLDLLGLPLSVDVAAPGDRYETMRGEEREPKPGDMLIRDACGIVSSIVLGPDRRTKIGPGTRSVLFAVYAPAGIGAAKVSSHLAEIRRLVLGVAPEAAVEVVETVEAV